MKKTVSKLALHRETVLSLERELRNVSGGRPFDTKIECSIGCDTK